MKYSRGRRRSQFLRQRKKRNFLPLLTFLVLLFILIFSLKVLFSAIFSGGRDEDIAAEIKNINGQVQLSIDGGNTFLAAFTQQPLFAGDLIKTAGQSLVSLELPGGTFVFLNEKTELKIITLEKKADEKKTFRLQLIAGEIWTRVAEDSFNQTTKSTFKIETNRVEIEVLGGAVFDLSSNEMQDVLRLIKGNVSVEVVDGKKTKKVGVGVGQKLVINTESLNIIKAGGSTLEIIDSDFIRSEWHLKNLEQFFQTESTEIRRQIEIESQKLEAMKKAELLATGGDNLETSTEVESPKFLSPADGTRIPATTESIEVAGSAPENAVQVIVNGYTLTKFQPGDRKWTYFAAKKFGTLVAGENIFSVVAVSREGKKSQPAVLKVYFEGETKITASTEKVEMPIVNANVDTNTTNLGNSDFPAPKIVNPPIANVNEPYQTSAAVVTIKGIVDPKTNAVLVTNLSVDKDSHFRLERFKLGDSEFSYIANANYGNMKEGENIFEIQALGPDNKKSSSIVRIFYTPLNVGN